MERFPFSAFLFFYYYALNMSNAFRKQALQVHPWWQLHRQLLGKVGKARGLWVWNGFHGVHLTIQHPLDYNQTSLYLPFGGSHVSQFYYLFVDDLRWISKRVWVWWRGLKLEDFLLTCRSTFVGSCIGSCWWKWARLGAFGSEMVSMGFILPFNIHWIIIKPL